MKDDSPRRRLWPCLVALGVATAALTACLLWAGYLYLPQIVTDRLPADRVRRLGFADFTGRITDIGPARTTAGPLIFGHADRPALAIASIALDYSPAELRRKKIRRVRISDVVVNAGYGPDGIVLPGLDLKALAQGGTSPDDKPSGLADIAVQTLEIRGGLINLTSNAFTTRIFFEADLTFAGPGMTAIDARVRLSVRDQQLAVAAQADMNRRQVRIRLDGPAIVLDRFADLAHRVPGLDVVGKVSLRAEAKLGWGPLSLSDAHAVLTWHGGRLAYASAVLGPGPDGVPAMVTVDADDIGTWRIGAEGLRLYEPVPVAIVVPAAGVTIDAAKRKLTGTIGLTVAPFAMAGPAPAELKSELQLPLALAVTGHDSDAWSAEVKTAVHDRLARSAGLVLGLAGSTIQAAAPRFQLKADGGGKQGSARFDFSLNGIRATLGEAAFDLPAADGGGQVKFAATPQGRDWTGDAHVTIPDLIFSGHGMVGKFDGLTVSAGFKQPGKEAPALAARLRIADGQADDTAGGLHLSGLRLDLPFGTQGEVSGREGTFGIGRMVYRGRALGAIQGRINRTKDAYAFTASHASDLLPAMTAAVTGSVFIDGSRLGQADLAVEIPPYDLPAESDLGRFVPAAQGVRLSGTLSARVKAALSGSGWNGALDVAMADGALTLAEKNVSVEGIAIDLNFPELPRIRSGPAQQIRFARAAMGAIVVDGGSLAMQVESPNTLFVEKGLLSWCGGKVDLQSLRIAAGRQDYHVGLYCQRLSLSRILEQLGSVNARGTGTLNGRIPVIYANGKIRFDDGFLFSTPGEGGRIQLTATQVLTRGIAPDTPQYAQVDLAREALKDYSYAWAKLGLASEGEDLVMRLQFDGKPTNPLPFIYKKEIGSFVRVESDAQGSHFQGISLDVNLRLPLNRLLQYKDIVKMIE